MRSICFSVLDPEAVEVRLMATFRKCLSIGVEVRASAEQVWRVLADLGQLPCWNPILWRMDGRRATNGDHSVRRAQLGKRMFRFSVLNSEPNRQLRWQGRFLFPGLLHDEGVFVIEPIDEERVWFTLQQIFTGLLVPLCGRIAEASAKGQIQEVNRALSCGEAERAIE
jgi:hypothetical protein